MQDLNAYEVVMPFEISAGSTDIPDGTYTGSLESVEVQQATVGFNGAEPDKFRLWSFLLDVNGTLVPISATTSMNTGPKTKTFQWLTALLGTAPQAGETIEDPIGKQVLVTVSHVDHKGNPSQYAKVSQLTAYKQPATVAGDIPR